MKEDIKHMQDRFKSLGKREPAPKKNVAAAASDQLEQRVKSLEDKLQVHEQKTQHR